MVGRPLRDLVRGCVAGALGDEAGVLVVDETGFLKKGERSVGVARQRSGTAGRIENCQVGVFAACASRLCQPPVPAAGAGRWGRPLIDRRLHLPRHRAEDAARRARVSAPPEAAFATKPVLARDMIVGTPDAGVACAWVLADALHGSDCRLRRMLEERGQPHVLAVRSNRSVKLLDGWLPVRTDPAAMADAIPDADWQTLSAGEGAKGPGLYRWARLPLRRITAAGFERWLLIRRSRHDPGTRAYFAYAPAGASLASSLLLPACAGASSRRSKTPRTTSGPTAARPAPGAAGTAT